MEPRVTPPPFKKKDDRNGKMEAKESHVDCFGLQI